MKKNLLVLALVLTLPLAGFSQCSVQTLTSTTCLCKGGGTNCDLLPDMIVAPSPLQSPSGYTEYPQVCNPPCSGNDGRLRLTVTTPNVGHGPMETRGTPTYVCGTDTFVASSNNTIPATCPVTGLPPKQLIVQRIYHKDSTSILKFTDRPAGTMTYHASHGHQHVDEWGRYTLRTSTADPNPVNWPVVGTGAKLAFCLLDIGACTAGNGYCRDSANNILHSGNMENYGLGGGNYGCSNSIQGISAGYVDTYSQGLDGMWINLPPGLCNGQYWIVVELDHFGFFTEENENNNVIAVPVTLTQQGGSVPSITANGSTSFCQGGNVTLTASAAADYLWSNGATTQSIVVSQAGSYSVTVNSQTTCPATSNAVVVTVNGLNVTANATPNVICPGENVQLTSTNSGSGLATGPVSFTNNTVVNIPDNNAAGASSSLTVSGISPATLNSTSIVSVQVNITHTYDGDLVLALIAPSGNTINLSNRRGGSGNNFVNTVFSASATTAIAAGSPPFTGSYIPDGAFSSLTGNVNGTWTFKVTDLAGTDIGTINNWTLTVLNQVPPTYSYNWTSSPAGFTSTAQNPLINPTANTSYTITVTENETGCQGSQTTSVAVGSSIEVTTNTPAPICSGSSTILTATGAGTFTWSPSTGLSATTGASVTASPTTTTTYLVIGNSSGCIDSAYVTVNVLSSPSLVAGTSATICNGQSVALNASGADSFNWSPSLGLNTTSGPSVNASPSTSTIYTVTGTNANGCSTTASITITVNDIPVTPLSVSGAAHNCLPLSNALYSIGSVSGASSYLWTVPSGITINSGQGTTGITVSATTTVTGDICVNASNGCGTSAQKCFAVTTRTSTPSTPGSVTGPTRACPGETATLSVAPVTRATFYNWSLPAGVNLISGGGTNSINVAFVNGFTSSSVSVNAGNGCGVSGARVRNITLNNPGTPSSIVGESFNVCSSTQQYSVTAVAGMTYLWTVPSGATINGPANGNSISVTFTGSFTSGNISVQASNLCGTSPLRTKTVRGTTAQPSIISGATSVCTGQTNVVYTIAPVTGAVTYLWSVPSGCQIVSGQGTTTISVTMSATPRTGNITVRGVNGCGSGTARSLSITINSCPKFNDGLEMTQQMIAYPNPAHEYVEVLLQATSHEAGTLTVLDILGKTKYTQAIDVSEGRNSFMVDLRKLHSGVYIIRVDFSNQKFTQKLIVD